MTVAVFVENESEAKCLIQWGVDFAAADHTDLLVVVPRRSKGKQAWEALDQSRQDDNPLVKSVYEVLLEQDSERIVLKEDIAAGVESSELDRIAIETRELIAPDPAQAFVEEVEKLNITLLLLPARQPVRTQGSQEPWHQRLFTNAPCEVIMVRGSAPTSADQVRIMIATENEDDRNTQTAIKRGCQLAARSTDGSITLLFVRPDDDLVAAQIANKHLEKLARSVPEKQIKLEKKIELADSLTEGIMRQDLHAYELVLVGTQKRRILAQLFRKSETLDETTTSLAAIRHAVPMTQQIWSRFQGWVRARVPQIDRELRISLVDRLQTSSAFDFDFVALISLSTLIAALGLVRNSGAVVIGAMLVAPLMTPLVAIGFSQVQGNEKLIRSALKSVLLGFTVALGIGCLVGLMLHLFAPAVAITSEMYDRGSPNLLDLIVALASGVAAAYAMGRPNLISALPGVAIAAALVPPIATSGLSLAMGDFRLFGGSLLLFATNIVAIILGTAITFWAVGINNRVTKSESGEKVRAPLQWPRYLFLGLVVLSFVLAAEMSIYNPLSGSPQEPTIQNQDQDQNTGDAELLRE